MAAALATGLLVHASAAPPTLEEEMLEAGSMGRVATETAIVRGAPRFFAENLVRLTAGAQVEIVATRGAWYQVRVPGRKAVTGYLHSSALASESRYQLDVERAGGGTVTYAERTAAARGFSPEVESRHRMERPETERGYRQIDRLERMQVSPEQVAAFMRGGGMKP